MGYSNKNSKHTPTPPSGLTPNQSLFIDAIHHKEMIIASGSAGVGKTYLSAVYAGYYHLLGKCTKIILTRPTVGTGKSIGFFPGSLSEKMEPWTQPFVSVLEEYLTKGKVEMMMKNNQIEIVPFEVIRGRSFDDSFIILDEAQNTTEMEMKAFVTRQGKNSTTIINGDLTQSDLKTPSNGLQQLFELVKTNPKLQENVSLIEFTIDDIVRSELCKLWVEAYENLSI